MINIDRKNVVFMEKLLIKTYRIFFSSCRFVCDVYVININMFNIFVQFFLFVSLAKQTEANWDL